MVAAKLPDNEFIRLFESLGPAAMSKKVGQGTRRIHDRRRNLEVKYKRQIASPIKSRSPQWAYNEHPGRLQLEVRNGCVLIGSDAHYWPGAPSLMHQAFVRFCKDLKPTVVIMNGDVTDLCTISRHPPIGWAKLPSVDDEIEAAQERLGEIELAAFKARKIWSLGNHDSRYEALIATKTPELRRVPGTKLSDHYPLWESCWSVFINEDIVVKHRFKGGLHATHNNAVNSGRTMITGHLHSAKVTGFTDYNGTRWGVDTGCIADPAHRAFLDYTEDNPKNWRDGFCVLTFREGRLLPPDLVLRWDASTVTFQGKLLKIGSANIIGDTVENGMSAIKTLSVRNPEKGLSVGEKRPLPRARNGARRTRTR